MKSQTQCIFVFATVCTVTCLAMVAVSFSTNYWLETYVDRVALKRAAVTDASLFVALGSDQVFFTRYRGMFRTCFPGNETAFIDVSPYKVSTACLAEQGYQIPTRDTSTLSYGSDYETRMHLMRAHFAMFCLALLFILICCVLGVVGCWSSKSKMIRYTGIMMLIGMLCIAGGMAFFHGYYYLEISQLSNVPGFPAYINRPTAESRYVSLTANSRTQYGYSYIVAWVGMGFAAISAILYLVAAYRLSEEEWREKGSSVHSDRRDRRPRNKAYDYMAEGQAPPGYPAEYDPKYQYNNGAYSGATYPAAYPDNTLQTGYDAANYDYHYGGGAYRY